MKFEYEEFETIEDVLIYLVSVAPYMKQILPNKFIQRDMFFPWCQLHPFQETYY